MIYSKKTKSELIALCKERGIKGYSKKIKYQLIKMLEAYTVNEESKQVAPDAPVTPDAPVVQVAPETQVASETPVVQVAPETVVVSETSVVSVVPVASETPVVLPKNEKVLRTEDTGKIFEMAICLAYGIPYDGKYKYSMETAEKLKTRLSKLTELFPMCRHTAKRGARYDYTSVADETLHLSAKSTKKGVGKVAPQVIGQSQPKKFCDIINTEYTTITALKQHIQTDIVHILPILVGYTFDCPTIYYNEDKNTIRYITLNTPIEWDKYQFKWTCNWTEWSNSSTLKIVVDKKEIALLECQFHTTSRTNMAIRWFYENLLTVFKENINIIDI